MAPGPALPPHPPHPAPTPLNPFQSIEETFLGFTRLPFPLRTARDGWRPDPPETSCHRCAQGVHPFDADATGCPRCRDKRLPWQRIVRLGAYAPPLSHYVHDLKFTRFRSVGAHLGTLLGAALQRELAVNARTAAGAPATPRLLVVPMPMSRLRRLARGIDHSRVIATAAARVIGAEVHSPLIRRYRPPQLNLPASSRQGNVAKSMRAEHVRAFLAAEPWLGPLSSRVLWNAPAKDSLIIVIDDVTTTNSTLRECCRALRQGFKSFEKPCPPIWIGVVAATGDDRE